MPTAADRSTHSQGLPPKDRTLADVVAVLERDGKIGDRRRKSFLGAVRTLCSIVGRAPEAVPAAILEIDRLL